MRQGKSGSFRVSPRWEYKRRLMSPGGTTAYGYSALESGNVRASCIDAIEEAYKRAKEL